MTDYDGQKKQKQNSLSVKPMLISRLGHVTPSPFDSQHNLMSLIKLASIMWISWGWILVLSSLHFQLQIVVLSLSLSDGLSVAQLFCLFIFGRLKRGRGWAGLFLLIVFRLFAELKLKPPLEIVMKICLKRTSLNKKYVYV